MGQPADLSATMRSSRRNHRVPPRPIGHGAPPPNLEIGGPGCGPTARLRTQRAGAVLRSRGQLDGEGGPDAEIRTHGDGAAVFYNQVATQRQTETTATGGSAAVSAFG